MKKIKNFFISFLVLLSVTMSLTACDASDVESSLEDTLIFLQINNPYMYANGIEKEIDEGRGTTPILDNGRTLVPIRSIIEECGGTVDWNQDTQTVTLNYNSDEIKLIINSNIAYLNSKKSTLDVAPQVINGRTMLPIRFIAEGFNYDVRWDDTKSVITITNNAKISDTEIPSDWLISAATSIPDTTSQTAANRNLKVHFINVGQGDSTFIELPDNKTLLIDAGPSTGIVPNYIKSNGYNNIDYVIATHPDADHINGMPEVLDTFKIDTFYMPEKEHTTNIFNRMLDAVSNNGCAAEYAMAGKSIINSNDLKVYFVGPVKIYGDNNNCSAVVKLEYKQTSLLFTGDAEYSSESDMLEAGYDLTADILKIGHHGSSSSSSPEFIKAVSPKDAIISVGANNKYGHPTNEVLSILSNAGINIYRTDEVGTIVVTSDGNSYTIDKIKSSIQPNAPPETENTQNVTPIVGKTTQQEITSQNSSAIVYRTKTGSKYHNAGCSYLKSSIQTTVAEAKIMGLTPCSRCNPPQ